MKKKILFILILAIILIITDVVLVIIFNQSEYEQNEVAKNIEEIDIIENNTITKKDNEVLIIEIENKEEKEGEKVEEEKEEVEEETGEEKDAAELTQEIYSINGPIGTLNIPKTGLTTKIYSNVTVSKMEEMPCFLYTTGGLNKIGTTLFVGHNRRDGRIFANNNQLEEGDEFYFTDLRGKEVKYTIYSKFLTVDTDTSFLDKDVSKPTIALSCCTDDDNDERIIILGEAK